MNPGTENISEAVYKSRNESEGKEGRETEERKTEKRRRRERASERERET